MYYRWVLFCLLALSSFLQGDESVQNPYTHRIFQFENQYVRVWRAVIMPHQPLKMNHNDYPRVIVGLKGGMLTKIQEGEKTDSFLYDTGEAHWISEDLSRTLQGELNESDEPIEVMIIEIKTMNLMHPF